MLYAADRACLCPEAQEGLRWSWRFRQRSSNAGAHHPPEFGQAGAAVGAAFQGALEFREASLVRAGRTGELLVDARLSDAEASADDFPLEGDANGAPHPDPTGYATKFTGKYMHRTIGGGVGHNLPQEAPEQFVDAVLEVDGYSA